MMGRWATLKPVHRIYAPLERIAPDEQRNPLSLLQMHDAESGREQLLLVDLEQLVARKRVENMLQRLEIMAVRRKPGALLAPFDLAPQDLSFTPPPLMMPSFMSAAKLSSSGRRATPSTAKFSGRNPDCSR